MAVYTFLENYDWSGKTIHPFCTHEGSGLSGGVDLSDYAADHEAVHSVTAENQVQLIGESRVTASVFGGDRHAWRLRLQIDFANRNGI